MKKITVLATAIVLTVLAAPAASAADEIGLSRDGVTWGDTISGPLFDPDVRWVPGDSRTVSFFVRNDADSGAELTVTARSADTDRLLAAEDISLRARAHGDWVPLRNGQPSSELTAASVRRGESVRVDLEASFDPASTNTSQRRDLALVLDVTLTDDLAGAGSGAGADADGPSGWLPQTGVEVPELLMWLAGGAIVVGAVVLAAGRREEARHA